ncbi:hypothetical protein R1sor_007613 [Riccia sorocarpa]|uniref:Uncharacterized protein n=1 Tax=Riccia sorocarpa TaxID=122646 RepID=A0ABD3HQZ7_9MARC
MTNEAPREVGATSEAWFFQSQGTQRPRMYEDDIDDDDMSSEEGDTKKDDDCLDNILRRKGAALIRPDSQQVSSQAGTSSPTLSGPSLRSTKNVPLVDYSVFLDGKSKPKE